jgi:hypothetical protein
LIRMYDKYDFIMTHNFSLWTKIKPASASRRVQEEDSPQ